jgi:hypothetical protein
MCVAVSLRSEDGGLSLCTWRVFHNTMFLCVCRGDSSRSKDAGLSSALEGLEAQLSLSSPSGLQPRMEALKAACRWV